MDRGPDFDIESRRRSLEPCPDCGGSSTITVRDFDIVAFLCEECGACWRIELGYLQRVKRPGQSFGEP